MNKLFTKIVGAALGLTMAIGVGVAVASNSEVVRAEAAAGDKASGTWTQITSASDINTTDDFLLGWVYDKTPYYSIGTVTSKGVNTSSTITDAVKIRFESATGGYYIKHTSSTYLNNASGTDMSLGSKSSVWTIDSDLYVVNTSNSNRFLGAASNSASARLKAYASSNKGSYPQVFVYKQSTSYTISYNENGGSGTMTSTTGSDPAVASCTFEAPTGKHFDHWNTSATDNGTTYAVGAKPKATITLYAIWATNSYTVDGTIVNGSLSSTANVSHGSALNITINPSSGYKLPTTLTSVIMGGSTYAGYTYNPGTGAFSIASVTGNVFINATCPVNATTYTISGTIINGSLTGDTGEQVEGRNYEIQISPSALYKYPTSVTVTGAGEEGSGWEYDSSDGIVYIYGLGGNVTITATCPAASITSITVSGQKTAFTLGEDFSFGGTVKASYDDVAGSTNVAISTDLVNIDSSAYDAFTESNSYTISVALKSNGSVSTSYTVSVTRKSISTTTTYVKVSTSQSDWSGKYVILSSDNAYVMGTTITSSRVANGTLSDLKNSSGNEISSNDTVIASGYTNYVYTIAKSKSGNYYTISPDTGTNAGKYLAGKSAKNQADFISDGTDDLAKWTITYSSGFEFVNLGRASQTDTPANKFLRSNTTFGFACYSSSQSKAPHLFAKTDTPSGIESLIRLTATGPAANVKTEDDVVYASDFVATALFDTAESTTVTPTVVSVNGDSASAHLVEGPNTVVLSYTDPNDGTNIKTCEVTVIAAKQTAVLDGIIWDKEATEITQFDGSTIVYGSLYKHYSNDTIIALDIADCTVAVYSNNSGTKAHDIADPTSYKLSLENDNGKYLGVTYESYTLYSGKLSVVEVIDDVYPLVEQYTFKTKASETNPFKVGDEVVFAYDDASMEMIGIDSGTKGVVSSFTTNPEGSYSLEVCEGYTDDTFAFKNGTNYVAFTSSATSGSNNLWTQTTIDAKSSWTVEYDGTDVTITNCFNTGRSLRYNTTNNQERISGYVSSSTSFPLIQVYIGEKSMVPSGDSFANTNATVQKAVLQFAEHFNGTMDCVNSGTTDNVASKWSTLSSGFSTAMSGFTGDDLAHFKALFANAYSVEGGDTLQDMLARYDYIVSKYKLSDDFLHNGAGRGAVAYSARVTPFNIIGNNGNTVAIIVIISMISITAIGGYFFLRRRKEN